MIALLMGLFLLGALLTIVQANKQAFGSQNMLAQMQDNERMAMTMMTDVIQSAGYFSNPIQYPDVGLTPRGGALCSVGQAITGATAALPGDQISVRYWTDTAAVPSDAHPQLQRRRNTPGGQLMMVNTFQIIGRPARLHDERHAVHARGRRQQSDGHQHEHSLRRQGERRRRRQQRRYLHEREPGHCHAGDWGNVISVQVS
jgi:hypothetical protein